MQQYHLHYPLSKVNDQYSERYNFSADADYYPIEPIYSDQSIFIGGEILSQFNARFAVCEAILPFSKEIVRNEGIFVIKPKQE